MRRIDQQDSLQYEPSSESTNLSGQNSSTYEKKLQIYSLGKKKLNKGRFSSKKKLIPILFMIISLLIFSIFIYSSRAQANKIEAHEGKSLKNQSLATQKKINEKESSPVSKQKQNLVIKKQSQKQKPKQQKIQDQNNYKVNRTHYSEQKSEVKQNKSPSINQTNSKEKISTHSEYQKEVFSDDYEYDVDGEFIFWDLNPLAKSMIFERYNSLLKQKKIIKGDKYMEINYGKNDQFLNFSKTYEANIDLIDWDSINLTAEDKLALSYDLQNALKQRRNLMQRLLTKYREQYNGKQGVMDPVKNITYQRFLQNLQYQKIAGQNLQQNLQAKEIYERQKEYFRKAYHTDQVKEEINSCVVIPTYNNVVDYRYLWNLETILQQDYSNYRLIIIDDGSTDQTVLRIARHLKWRGVSKQKVILIRNKNHITALANIYYGLHKYCDYNQIFYIIDGDDEIVGTQVFKLYNAIYQQKKYYMLYSNHFQYESKKSQKPLPLGLPFAYPQQIKKKSGYRTFKHAYSQLRTGMSDLFLLTSIKSLQNQNGQFYTVLYDNALFFPVMQMSCGRVDYITEVQYWYNANTGMNDWYNPNQGNYGRTKKGINNQQKHYQCIHKTIKQIEIALKAENAI